MCGGPPAEDTDRPKVDGHLKASITESFQLPSLSLPGWHMGARSAQGLQLNQMISKEQGDCGAKFPFTEEERPPTLHSHRADHSQRVVHGTSGQSGHSGLEHSVSLLSPWQDHS